MADCPAVKLTWLSATDQPVTDGQETEVSMSSELRTLNVGVYVPTVTAWVKVLLPLVVEPFQ